MTSADLQYVSFRVGDEDFGIDILQVQEIIRPVELTTLPNAPSHVLGVLNLRGRIVPVIDLRRRFGLPEAGWSAEMRIVVADIEGRIVGLRVDAVRAVLRVEGAQTEAPPELATRIGTDFIRSVAKLNERMLLLLDLDKVLAERERGLMHAAA